MFEGVYCNTSIWLTGTTCIWDLKQKCLYHTATYQLLQHRQYRVRQWITWVLFKSFSTQRCPFHTVTCLWPKGGLGMVNISYEWTVSRPLSIFIVISHYIWGYLSIHGSFIALYCNWVVKWILFDVTITWYFGRGWQTKSRHSIFWLGVPSIHRCAWFPHELVHLMNWSFCVGSWRFKNCYQINLFMRSKHIQLRVLTGHHSLR